MSETLSRRVWAILAAVWLGVIAIASFNPIPLDLDAIREAKPWILFSDLTVRIVQTALHAVLYGIGAVLCVIILPSIAPGMRPARVYLGSLGIVVLIGLVVEIIQVWIPNRAADPVDLSANVAGAAIFLGLAWRFWNRRQRREPRNATRERQRMSASGGAFRQTALGTTRAAGAAQFLPRSWKRR